MTIISGPDTDIPNARRYRGETGVDGWMIEVGDARKFIEDGSAMKLLRSDSPFEVTGEALVIPGFSYVSGVLLVPEIRVKAGATIVCSVEDEE